MYQNSIHYWKNFFYDFSEIDVAVLLHLTAEQHQQDMNEPANFQPDDPNKLEKMNCTGNLNNPPYMPRKHNCTTAAQLLHYPILILTNNFVVLHTIETYSYQNLFFTNSGILALNSMFIIFTLKTTAQC